VLANEMFASRLGRWLGLPVPEVQIVEISEWLIEHTPELCLDIAGRSVRCKAGRHVGSRYVVDPAEGQLCDYLPESLLAKVRNPSDLILALVLDKWTGNSDGRQAVFVKKPKERLYTAWLIDQGYCFGGPDWNFQDLPLHGVYPRNYIYKAVTGWDAFEPVLTKAEEADPIDLWRCAESIPPEWYDFNTAALERLVETLDMRRKRIRDLIAAFRDSPRNPFPNWRTSVSCFSTADQNQTSLSEMPA
jgi:hypothetical protein